MFEPVNRSFIVQLEDTDASRSALDAKTTEGAIETRVCMCVYIYNTDTNITRYTERVYMYVNCIS